MAETSTTLTDRERQTIERVAEQRGVTFEEAAQQLVREGLARRVQKKTGRRPTANIRRLRR